MKRRSFLSLLLVFGLIMQMLAPAWAVPAKNTTTSATSQRSSDVAKAQEEFQKSYDTIRDLKEIELGAMTSACVGGVTIGQNIGTFFKNGWDKLTNDGKNQQEYVDYIKQIEDANAKIRQAKKDAEEMKKAYDSGKIDQAKNADASKIAKGGLAAQAEAVDTLRDTLTTAGTSLQKVGKLCSTISTVLGVVNAVLKVVSIAFPPSAPFIGPFLAFADPAAKALGIAGPLIQAAGDSLVESAKAGQMTDDELFKNMAVDVAVEGGKMAAKKLVTKGMEAAGGKIAEEITKKYGDELGSKIVGTCTNAWDPNNLTKAAVQSDLADYFGDKLSSEAGQEALEKMVDKTVDFVNDKTDMTIPSVSGFVDEKIDEGLDWAADKSREYLKKEVKEAGLNSGGGHSGGGHGF